MMIDMRTEIIEDLRNLLTQLDNQHQAIKDNTMGWFLHDTKESYENNSDPQDMNEMDINTLILASSLKQRLKL